MNSSQQVADEENVHDKITHAADITWFHTRPIEKGAVVGHFFVSPRNESAELRVLMLSHGFAASSPSRRQSPEGNRPSFVHLVLPRRPVA